MKSSYACCGFQAASFSRRHLLKVGGLGLLGLTMPRLLRAEAQSKLKARANKKTQADLTSRAAQAASSYPAMRCHRQAPVSRRPTR